MSIASPCINICEMSPDTGWCIGCQRSLEEIGRWGLASDEEKLAILAAVEERREFLAEAGMSEESKS